MFTSNNIDVVEFLNASIEAGFISVSQAVQMGNMVEMVSLDTMKKQPNPKRVENANSCNLENVSGVPVVDCKSFAHWDIMNQSCTVKLIENEIKKQRDAGFSPYKVVIKGYRVVVRLENRSKVTSAYKKLGHGKLQASPFSGLQWVYDNSECGFHIDLNKPNFK